uniref:Uncharacterized protein n=1 Tax=Steinernema glaseri TaxID=37863 RepID=A0A1I7ZN73_9BILA
MYNVAALWNSVSKHVCIRLAKQYDTLKTAKPQINEEQHGRLRAGRHSQGFWGFPSLASLIWKCGDTVGLRP